MINALFAQGNHGSYDQGLLMHALSGRLWPIPVEFVETHGLIPEEPGGAVVVLAGRHLANPDGMRYVQAGLKRLPWALVFHLGDEELNFPSEQLKYPGRRLLVQCPNPFQPLRGDRDIPLGWPEDCRAWLRQQPRLAASGRRLWSWAGQVNHEQRLRLLEALKARPEGEGFLAPSAGFGQGLGREAYYASLATSCIIPCPSGNFSPETFRLYEALEAGCIPVAARTAPNGGWQPDFNYWKWRYGRSGFLRFNFPGGTMADSEDLIGILNAFASDPAWLQEQMTRCLAWWIGEKRAFALDLCSDLRDLGADVPVPPVTVIVTASPVPAHPSTEMIEDTIRRIRSYPDLAKAEILICCDGVRPDLEHRRNDYEEFLRVLVDKCNWNEELFGCLPIIFDEWTHQAAMVKHALTLVRSPLVLLVEHDTHPLGEIPVRGIVDHLLAEVGTRINYVRLHIFESVLDEHRELYGPTYRRGNNPLLLMETRQWSQRPHFARAGWYREILDKWFPNNASGFIEDVVHSPGQQGLLGLLHVYAPEGSMLRSGTCDGRRDDPKAPVTR